MRAFQTVPEGVVPPVGFTNIMHTKAVIGIVPLFFLLNRALANGRVGVSSDGAYKLWISTKVGIIQVRSGIHPNGRTG